MSDATLEEPVVYPGNGPAPGPSQEDVEIIDALCCEVEELLQSAERNIARLRDYVFTVPYDRREYIEFLSGLDIPAYLEALKGVNRFVHTVKGNAGFMKLERLKTYCHRLEELTVAIMGGKLYMDRQAYALIEQIPAVIGRFFDRIKEVYADTDVPVDGELSEIERVKGILQHNMGDEEIALSTFQKQDLGLVRKASKNLKVSLDLKELDKIVGDYQIAVHTVVGILHTLNADADKLSEANKVLNDHLEKLLASAQDSMVLTRYQRIVADLGKALGKEIDFTVTRNTALARPDVWDHCHNAMVHLVRNAVDHGVERPEERKEKGKPPRGAIELDIFEDHKSAFIVLSDDGNGIDPEKVSSIALQRGAATEQDLKAMSREEVQKLIFRAGFSTKEEATDVSGRGVGMDAVIKEVEGNLGGKLSLQSDVGKGTKILIEIPKSETLTECVLFGTRSEAYAIPKVGDMSYLDCDPKYLESVLATTRMFTGTGHPFPILPIMSYLEPGNHDEVSLKGYTIIRLVGEHGEYGIAAPRVFGHRRMKIERKKTWDKAIGRSDIVYGYGVTDPITVVLDLEKLEALALSQ